MWRVFCGARFRRGSRVNRIPWRVRARQGNGQNGYHPCCGYARGEHVGRVGACRWRRLQSRILINELIICVPFCNAVLPP